MARVNVTITDRAIISALNTPGGAVHEWRNDTAEAIIDNARLNSPVNDPANATHRGGVVGTYAAAWTWSSSGSNGARLRATILNSSDHADIVEYGRRSTYGRPSRERFGWVEHVPSGAIEVHGWGTSGRAGNHVLRDAVNARGLATGDYAPLP